MSRELRHLITVVAALALLGRSSVVHGLEGAGCSGACVCAGDCDGAGEVTTTGIITLINIVLGNAASSACEAGLPSGSGVDITVVIQAINNTLGGCVLPSTATPSALPTATATPEVPNIAGVWTEDQLQLVSADCNEATANLVAQGLAQLPLVCDTQLTQNGTQIHGVDCTGSSGDGTIDAAGMLRFTQPPRTQTIVAGCALTATQSLVADASHSPTTALSTLELTFSGSCSPFADCTAHLQSRFTKR
jgi:hypothetical protein